MPYVAGLFRCKDSNVCLRHSEVCDGITHCLNHRDDEKYCGVAGVCDWLVWLVKPLLGLNCNLSLCRAHYLCCQALSCLVLLLPDVLCDVCQCDGSIAYCDNSNITSLPTATNTYATRSLRGLFLAVNRIRTISTSTFARLHWLTKLILSQNEIPSLGKHWFKDLVNLHQLDLSFNHITDIHPNAFEGLAHLKHLSMNNNRLKLVQAVQLRWLVSVELLTMEDNDLGDIEKGTFDGVRLYKHYC